MEPGQQDITNTAPVEQQVNVNAMHGDIQFTKVSRLGQRFKRLKEEVENDIRYDGFIEDFKRYNTELDGKSMPDKLADGGFNALYIQRATIRKHQYSKKLEKNKLYETAQLIDMELFAIINLHFETYVEPLIERNAERSEIKACVKEKIVDPIFKLINEDGQEDTFLNYNVDDIFGMIFFLTGKCHLNWTVYDSL